MKRFSEGHWSRDKSQWVSKTEVIERKTEKCSVSEL